MKKICAALMFAICILSVNFCSASLQIEYNFDWNKDFNSKLQPLSAMFTGRVVGVSTYLSLRERPTVNSRELMRIPSGARLYLRYDLNPDWWEVVSVTFNGRTYQDDGTMGIGWISSKYVKTDRPLDWAY